MKKPQLFPQNHGLSPLQKSQFCLLFKSMFILSRKACFLTRTSPNTFSGFILHNTKRSKNFQFLTKTMDYPFGKMLILWFFDTDVFVVQKGLFPLQNVANRFFTIYVRDLWHWNTGGYKGLLGVTRSYRVLQGVTGGYRGLQGVTGGDKGIQRVTRGYKGLQRVTRGYKG